ncbi:MAG: trpR [Gammaproteobacteria bacterium]|jgi:TrpR-related protein YerC/YecD|nr:trpR [Gammaproteobacteria bacterium]
MKKLRKVGAAKEFEKVEAEQDLFKAIAALQTKEEVKKFLQDLCTPAEIQAMADRWRVVDLLKQDEPYRQIYEKTGVSVTTIGRVARCLLLGEGGYNLIYKRLHK